MRLTLIGPTYPYRGGIAHYTGLLSRALTEHGHEVQLISFKRQYPAWLYPGKSDQEPGKPFLEIEARYTLDPLYPWTWIRTSNLIRGYQPQAAIIQWWTTFWAPAFSRVAKSLRKSAIPVFFVIHNVMPHEEKIWDRWLAIHALSQGDQFLVQSSREGKRLYAIFPSAKVRYCPLPIFDLKQPEKLSKETALTQLGLPPQGRVLLCFGIVRPYKGLKYAIEAVARLKERGHHYFLLVAGEIWEDKQLYQDQIEQLGILDQVILEDRYIPNDEIGQYFSAADIFLAPYTDGTQSAAIKLALGYGLPAVASDILADDLLNQIPQVRFVKPGDASDLALAIEAISSINQAGNSFSITQGESWDRLVRSIEGMIANQEERI